MSGSIAADTPLDGSGAGAPNPRCESFEPMKDETSEDAYSVEFESERNGARGPGFFQLDIRAGYRLRLGGDMTLDAFGEIFNVTDRANFSNPSGDRRSSNFLRLTGLRDGALCDVAPTLLGLLGIPQPKEMTGRDLREGGAA